MHGSYYVQYEGEVDVLTLDLHEDIDSKDFEAVPQLVIH